MNKWLFLLVICVSCACCSEHKTVTNVDMLRTKVIYKTKADFSNNVPIRVKDGKVIAYPAISDVSERKRPQSLGNGYLLDNFGVIENTVYTSYTIKEYSELTQQPTSQDLKSKIIELDPFAEMYSCKSTLSIEDIKNEAKTGFKNCKKIK